MHRADDGNKKEKSFFRKSGGRGEWYFVIAREKKGELTGW